MRPERSYATCDKWSTNPSLFTGTGGVELCADLQVLDQVKRDTPTSLNKNIRNKIAKGWAEM